MQCIIAECTALHRRIIVSVIALAIRCVRCSAQYKRIHFKLNTSRFQVESFLFHFPAARKFIMRISSENYNKIPRTASLSCRTIRANVRNAFESFRYQFWKTINLMNFKVIAIICTEIHGFDVFFFGGWLNLSAMNLGQTMWLISCAPVDIAVVCHMIYQ